MEEAFYLSGLVVLLGTLRVITHTNPIHAILYLILSLFSIACVFFLLHADLASALEIIVYAGAIIVMFVFVVMIIKLSIDGNKQERSWLYSKIWIKPCLLSLLLLVSKVRLVEELDCSTDSFLICIVTSCINYNINV